MSVWQPYLMWTHILVVGRNDSQKASVEIFLPALLVDKDSEIHKANIMSDW